MNLTISAKQADRKHLLIARRTIVIDDLALAPSLREFLLAVVKQQVTEYNSKSSEKNLLPFLSKQEIDNQANTGKIGLGNIYNENKADVLEAQVLAKTQREQRTQRFFCLIMTVR
ncbi:MAG TPA: hypothetical protein VM802_27345 [Chitinophaga sp.]|uniref:hypothetical protein n=1 Tax=Chitinophaga sp. TaxID=1869181 RepID=UPI002C543B8D|nr:hypothetical protein [Chitinophaga sp.]HVI48614.1 hypothetical protein [Chitinophaga sp.]